MGQCRPEHLFISEYLFNKEKGKKACLNEKPSKCRMETSRSLSDRTYQSSFFSADGTMIRLIFLDKYISLMKRIPYCPKQLPAIKTAIDFENNENQYKLIRKEKEAEPERRNFFTAALFIALLAACLLLNAAAQIQAAIQQKQIAENEAQFAKDQLQLFTQTC